MVIQLISTKEGFIPGTQMHIQWLSEILTSPEFDLCPQVKWSGNQMEFENQTNLSGFRMVLHHSKTGTEKNGKTF
jgi:hypothetical protein